MGLEVRPSRAASVAIRMRSGFFFGSVVEGPLDLLAFGRRGRAVIDGDPLVGPVGGGDGGRELLLEVALRVVVLGEDDDPGVVPPGRRPRACDRPERRQVRAHVLPNPVDQIADPGIGQAPRRLGDLGHLVEELLLAGVGIGPRPSSFPGWPPRSGHSSSAWSSSSESVARSSSLSMPSANRDGSPAWSLRLGPVPALAASQCRSTVRRWTRSVRANASTEESSRCWSPEISNAAAACLRFVSLLSRSSRSSRYWSRRTESRSSGVSGGRPLEVDLADDPLGEPAGDGPEVFLEPADHHVFEELLGPDGHAPAESLRVEDFQQGGEAVGVAVVGRGREEQPVLEPPGQVADGPGDLRVDGVFRAARRGGVVGLVEDEQRAGAEVAQPVAQRGRIGLVDQQPVRDEEARVGRPGIDAVAPLLPDPGDVVLVEDLEDQAEAVLQLLLPLEEHRRRAGDDDVLDLLAEQAVRGRSGRPRSSCRGRRRRR